MKVRFNEFCLLLKTIKLNLDAMHDKAILDNLKEHTNYNGFKPAKW